MEYTGKEAKFAEYGFNKSHTAAYAVIAYQTAWLKAHYPAEFIAATMSSELDNTDQLKVFYDDALDNKIVFLPPDVNHSVYRFMPAGGKNIRYALGAIKGTGEGAAEAIIEARTAGGPFKSLFDFCELRAEVNVICAVAFVGYDLAAGCLKAVDEVFAETM